MAVPARTGSRLCRTDQEIETAAEEIAAALPPMSPETARKVALILGPALAELEERRKQDAGCGASCSTSVSRLLRAGALAERSAIVLTTRSGSSRCT